MKLINTIQKSITTFFAQKTYGEYHLDKPDQILRNVEYLDSGVYVNPDGKGKNWFEVINVTWGENRTVIIEAKDEKQKNSIFRFSVGYLIRAKTRNIFDIDIKIGTKFILKIFNPNVHSLVILDKEILKTKISQKHIFINLSGNNCPVIKADSVYLLPGIYQMESIVNPYGHKSAWLQVQGTKIGNDITSLLQFSGDAFNEYRVEILYENGVSLYNLNGPYTLEQQNYKIKNGIINIFDVEKNKYSDKSKSS